MHGVKIPTPGKVGRVSVPWLRAPESKHQLFIMRVTSDMLKMELKDPSFTHVSLCSMELLPGNCVLDTEPDF